MLTLKIGGSIGLSNPDLRKRKRLPLEEAPLSHTANQLLHGWPAKWARTTCIAQLSQRLERWVLRGSMSKIWKETCTGGPEVFTEYT